MSAPIGGGSGFDYYTLLQNYQIQDVENSTEAETNEVLVPPHQQDTLQASDVDGVDLSPFIVGLDAPIPIPPDPQILAASNEDITNFENLVRDSSDAMVQNYIAAMPQSIQVAYATGKQDPQLDQLMGQMTTTAQMGTIGSLGLKSIPQADPVDDSSVSSLPPPGKFDATASPAQQKAQLLSNGMESTLNASKILSAQAELTAGGGAEAGSLSAFLKAIGDAITELKQFLGSMAQKDLKINLGQAVDAGSDAATLHQHKIEQAIKDQQAAAAGPGGIFGFIQDLVSIFISPILSLFGIDPLGGTGGMFSGLQSFSKKILDADVPLIGSLLRQLSKMTEGIPIVGQITQMLADHPMLLVLACVGGMMMTAGLPFGAVIFGPTLFTLGLLVEGGKLPFVDDLLGTNGEVPVIGGLISKLSGLIEQIPIAGDMFKSAGGDNQQAVLAGMITFAVLALTGGILLAPLLALLTMALYSSMSGQTAPTNQEKPNAAAQRGSTTAVTNGASSLAKKVAKDRELSESNAELMVQIQKLISILLQMQAAAQGGTVGPIPTEQLMGILNQLSAAGLSSPQLEKAKKLGNNGDLPGMMSALADAYGQYGSDASKQVAALDGIGSSTFTTHHSSLGISPS